MFDILILWKNSKLNTLSIEISNNCKAYISTLLAYFSSKMAPKPYIKTLISNHRSHDIENRVIVTHHNRSIDIENIEPPNHIEPKTDTVQLIIC